MAPVTAGSLILVTGANGFIAAHCIQLLLESRFRVRATVRSESKASTVKQTHTQAGADTSQLELCVVPDLCTPAAYEESIRGCDAVLHLASPFIYDPLPGEFEEKLLKPAIDGTKVVLEAAAAEPAVKRVVMMSSFASLLDASKDPQPGKVYTEKDWSPLTYEDGRDALMAPVAYRASKVLSEKAAWEFMEQNKPQWEFLSLCPGMVFGPILGDLGSLKDINASNQIVWGVIKGGVTAIPETKAPVWIDVNDLALSLFRSLSVPETGNHRFLITASSYCNQEIADIVRSSLPEQAHKIPLGEPGRRLADTHYSTDSSRAQKILGVKFKSLGESIVPLAKQLYEIEAKEGVKMNGTIE